MTLIIVPTPLTSQSNLDDEARIIISKRKLRKFKSITVNNVKLTDTELLGVAARKNQIKCLSCGDTIRSIYHYHSVRCSCGLCQIDGGEFELIRDCNGPYEEQTKYW